jgi:hypothetical protein
MSTVSTALTSRFLAVLLAVLLVLALLTILFLVQAHVGALPSLVQSTEAILQ